MPVRLFEQPMLYEVFTRFWLSDLSKREGRRIDLASVPEEELARLESLGFDYIWLMGVWTLGSVGPEIARAHTGLVGDFDKMLPGWTKEDVIGSPYAVARYTVDPRFGGDPGLERLRDRLARRGMGLVVDFVPNHTARDHHWVRERPEIYVRDADGAIAEGKDPYFPPWTDTAQLDYRLEVTWKTMIDALASISERADGVRCDMTMLLLEDIFARTWAHRPPAKAWTLARGEFWATAIDELRATRRDFLFLAEAYWDLEFRLQLLGFDFTYDKTLYDRLLHGSPASIRAHLDAPLDLQRRSARFLENHDEPRVRALLESDRRVAATVLAMTVPGLRFLHEGQLEGRRVKTSVHLARRTEEVPDPETVAFHERLLPLLVSPALRSGSFRRLSPREAWPGNATFDSFVAHRWEHPDQSVLVVVNYGPSRAQCRVTLDLAGIAARDVRLIDRIGGGEYLRDGDELVDSARGLYIDLPAWGVHLFDVTAKSR